MSGRVRNDRITLRISKAEKFLINKRMSETGFNNYADFIMQAISNCAFYNVDLRPLLSVAEQISRIGSTLNQIAKSANTTGNLYKEDIRDMQEKIKDIDDLLAKKIKLISKAKRGELPDYGIYKNKAD